MAITATDFQNIELAISAYADEAYTDAKRLVSTELVGSSNMIDVNGESYIGQMRSYDPINATINTPSLTVATDGSFTNISTSLYTYIKGAGSFGVDQVNLQKLISQQDGLLKVARDFAQVKAREQHEILMAVLKGVAGAEAAVGGGIATFGDVANPAKGFFVDINALGQFGAAATGAGDERKLIDATSTGAARGARLFKAVGMAFGDYEPDYMYMITSPEMMADLREANLVDETMIEDGNLTFQTIFGGKFRLLLTRSAQGNVASSANVNDRSTKTTFIVKPRALSFSPIPIEMDVEIDRNASSYYGGGNTEVWYRWAHIMHPMGYSWAGSTTAFANQTSYGAAASWSRVADPLNLPILPIFHS
jgi:hypothetical protein